MVDSVVAKYGVFKEELELKKPILAKVDIKPETLTLKDTFNRKVNLFNADCSLELLEDYTITQLDSWTDPVSGRKFATQWRIIGPSKQTDLTITAYYNDQVMRAKCFWEGSCSVSGTIEGTPVSGKAYVELTHSWENQSFNTPLSIFHRGLPNPLFFAVLLGIIFFIGIFVWVWVKFDIKKNFE